jgi:hypothetical protein
VPTKTSGQGEKKRRVGKTTKKNQAVSTND